MAAKQTSRLNVRMDPETRQMLEELAEIDSVSVSACLRRMIRGVYHLPVTGRKPARKEEQNGRYEHH